MILGHTVITLHLFRLKICFQISIEGAFALVTLPCSHLTLSGTIVGSSASTTALRQTALRLSTRQRAPSVAAEAKLWYGLDHFVLFIQTGTMNTLLQETDQCMHVC